MLSSFLFIRWRDPILPDSCIGEGRIDVTTIPRSEGIGGERKTNSCSPGVGSQSLSGENSISGAMNFVLRVRDLGRQILSCTSEGFSLTVMVRTIFFLFEKCGVVLDWLQTLYPRLVFNGVEDFVDGESQRSEVLFHLEGLELIR